MDNQNSTPEFDLGGCMSYLVENAVFALGMLLMFSKTSDLMAAFAPSNIMGYTDVEAYYGIACGLLIEGAMFAMKMLLPRSKNAVDWLWNTLAVAAPFLISGLAQVFDSFIIRDELSKQPPEVQLFVSWFVPSIPTMIIGLLTIKAIMGSIPKELLPKGLPVNNSKTSMFDLLGRLWERFSNRAWRPTTAQGLQPLPDPQQQDQPPLPVNPPMPQPTTD